MLTDPPFQVASCEHGKVEVKKFFGPEARGQIAHMNTEGQHRGAVNAAKAAAAKAAEKHAHDHKHGHGDHKHGHGDHKHDHKVCQSLLDRLYIFLQILSGPVCPAK